jgi:hypothetical protein
MFAAYDCGVISCYLIASAFKGISGGYFFSLTLKSGIVLLISFDSVVGI